MPATKFTLPDPFLYLKGLNSYHETEAVKDVLPIGQLFPQVSKHGLYSERLSGTSFTTSRKDNRQSYLYRLLPSLCHTEFEPVASHPLNSSSDGLSFRPNQSVWPPAAITGDADFLTGLKLIGGAGDPALKEGVSYYVYTAGRSMPAHQAFGNSDGDFCIVPQSGALDIQTELGHLRVRPFELGVIPRGIRFRVTLPDGPVRGFVLETFSGHFDLPDLGPIGSCGLANARDFQIPLASYLDEDEETELLNKFRGVIHKAKYQGSIFNVVGWHGNYYPFKYDLGKFNAVGSITYDHPDPSIFTVLTCPSAIPGQAAADVVWFGSRWLVMEDSFRPPHYHQNTMSEFSFLVKGSFDTDPIPPELAGLFSLNNTLSAHGPSSQSFDYHVQKDTHIPEKIDENNLGIMFESCYMIGTTRWAEELPRLAPREFIVGGFKKAKIVLDE